MTCVSVFALSIYEVGSPSLYTLCSSVHGTGPDDGRDTCISAPWSKNSSSRNSAMGTPVPAPEGPTPLKMHTVEPFT